MIGQEIAKTLDSSEWEVYLFDDFSNEYTPKSGFIGELVDLPLYDLIKVINPDVISHHAAMVSVGRSMYSPSLFFRQNVQFSADLIQVLIDLKWQGRMILAGSMAVHDVQSFYGLTKKTQVEMFTIWAKTYGNPLTVLNYYSVYGTNSDPSNPYTGILSIIVNQILTRGKVELYDDGGQTRDMIHVSDVAKYHNIHLKCGLTGTYEVKTGVTWPMYRIVSKIQEAMGTNVPVVFNGEKRAGDLYSTPKGLGTGVVSWEPIDINQGIAMYVKWIKDNNIKPLPTVEAENKLIKDKGLSK